MLYPFMKVYHACIECLEGYVLFQCGDCNCACNCQLPECNTINCICFEIHLKQPGGQQVPQGMARNIPGQQGYYGQQPGANVPYPGQHTNYGHQMSYPNPHA